MTPSRFRLIDLRCDWPLQYAGETTVFDPSLYQDVGPRIGQVEGYLQTVSAALIACHRSERDWSAQADPWAALIAIVARVEAEFPGRVLADADDLARWRDDPEGLAWAVIGVAGFDALIDSEADLARLSELFERGIRVFQPVQGEASPLAGSSAAGDGRGLTDLGRAFLDTLESVSAAARGPRPALDLVNLNPRSCSDVLDWLEAGPGCRGLVPVHSQGTAVQAGHGSPNSLTLDNLRRLRALGGWDGLGVGPPFHQSQEELRSAIGIASSIPFQGRQGVEGLAIGTGFLGVDATLPGLGTAAGVLAWLSANFDADTAEALAQGNARRLIERLTGGAPEEA